MRVRGRPHGRRSVARVVSLVTAGALAAGLGVAPHRDASVGTALPTSGFPAGEADEVTASPPWWRSVWPAEVRVVAATSRPGPTPRTPAPGPEVAPPLDRSGSPAAGGGGDAVSGAVPASDTVTGSVPGPSQPITGPEPVVDVLDAQPGYGPDRVRRTAEGFEVSRGTSQQGSGVVVTYTVEREPAVGVDLLALTAAVEEALNDPRSWSRDRTLRRVEDPAAADIRVLLATPSTVDRLCAEAGLDTEGRYSCWNGTFAALNARRWRQGAQDFDELTTYRRYLVNHEFGHGLGHGHLECPAPGALAPVMMQQTIGTGGCEANGWPYPDAPLE